MSSGGYDAANVADNAGSGSDNYCYGYGNVDTNGYYITTVKLETGKLVSKVSERMKFWKELLPTTEQKGMEHTLIR